MEYTVTEVEGQGLMFRVAADNNGEKVEFNVVCAQSEAEVPELVAHHLNFLSSPPVISIAQESPSLNTMSLIQELKAIVDAQGAEIAALKAGQNGSGTP
jgi:hypothetical protein